MANIAPHRGWDWRIRLGQANCTLALVMMIVQVIVATPSAQAQADATFTLLYSFKGGTDGAQPYAGLLRDAAGNLYGTTEIGGSSNNCSSGCGTVYKLDTTGAETVLYSFMGGAMDGSVPTARLQRDSAGILYGTTTQGGSSTNCFFGCGTVYKLDTSGTETVLYSFSGSPLDGRAPTAGLIRDAAGNMYGTTFYGGVSDFGTVYKLDTSGTETVLLHNFTGIPDGREPAAGLIRDAAGNLYGTTVYGGAFDFGTVYKLDTSGTETVLYSFTGVPDGQYPWAGLVRDAVGNLYGTTNQGGSFCVGIGGCGTVYKVDTTGLETVLHSFAGHPDGRIPYAALVRDAAGNLYGTTTQGGAKRYGAVFKLDSAGKLTVLHSFTPGATDGSVPVAGLIRDRAGNLYGTTLQGGALDGGAVFKLGR